MKVFNNMVLFTTLPPYLSFDLNFSPMELKTNLIKWYTSTHWTSQLYCIDSVSKEWTLIRTKFLNNSFTSWHTFSRYSLYYTTYLHSIIIILLSLRSYSWNPYIFFEDSKKIGQDNFFLVSLFWRLFQQSLGVNLRFIL